MALLRSVLVVLGCCLLAPVQAQTGEMHFGQLAMPWPAGYTVLRPGAPVLLQGPQGEEVAASVYLASPGARGAQARAQQRRFSQRSALLLRSAGASHGRVVHGAQATLADGSTLVAVASQSRGSRHYLLQFGVFAPAGHVGYVTVQGRDGSALAEYRRLLPLFQAARWTGDAQANGASVLASR